MEVLGHLDLCGPELIEGWIYWGGKPARQLSLQVFMGDELLGECVADRLRPDLADAGMGDGRCAFSFRIPPGPARNFRSVRLRVAGSVLYLLPDDYTAMAEPQVAPVATSGAPRPGLVTIVPKQSGQVPTSNRASPITLTASSQSV